MRIGMSCPYYKPIPPDGYGGIERVVSTLTEELVRRGHQVTLYAPPGSQTKAILTIHQGAEGLAEKLNGGNHDVIHDHAPHDAQSPVRNRLQTPSLSTYHCKDFTGWMRNVVCLSESQRRGLNLPEGTPVIQIPVDVGLYPHRLVRRDAVLFFGLMAPWKGPHRAIAAARKAGVDIILAGPNVEPFFTDTVRPLLGDDATYVGEAAGSRRTDLLARALAVLMPNSDEGRWREPGATIVSEAGACGTPVLALANGCLPEIVSGRNGRICLDVADMANAIGEARAGLWPPERVRGWAEAQFGVDGIAARYLSLYERVAGGETWN